LEIKNRKIHNIIFLVGLFVRVSRGKYFKFVTMLSIVGLFATFSAFTAATSDSKSDHAVLDDWVISSCDGKYTDIPASVPGYVNTDLMTAGIISSDPYFRYNELNMSWVAKTCWMYSSASIDFSGFDVGSSSVPIVLNLENVDTIADILFNDVQIGSCENSFHPHAFEIPYELIRLGTGATNALTIKMHSALSAAVDRAAKYPYAVPETENWNVWAEPSHRNFIRKTGSDMGWDWGPAYVATGLFGAVTLDQAAQGRMEHLIVHSTVDVEARRATLDVFVDLGGMLGDKRLPVESAFDVFLQDRKEPEFSVMLSSDDDSGRSQPSGDGHVMVQLGTVSISGDDFHLWWPRGYGEAYLYNVRVERSYSFRLPGSGPDRARSGAQSISRDVGLRVVELIQEPILETAAPTGAPSTNTETYSTGSRSSKATRGAAATTGVGGSLYTVPAASFYFKVNHIPIFCLGANFIPIDSFQSRVTDADREYVLLAAAEANMNMVRVWGGGLYQPDQFYSAADRMGIMVWQEVMLACALYPRNRDMLAEISAEVTHQIKRLNSHPSIVIWGGNNENEVALGWFPESNTNRDLYVSDYSELYGNTVYRAIQNVDNNQRPWVDSSPSNGLISTEPYAKLWGQASTAEAGDVHFYNYAMDCQDYTGYPTARFISEFGFQAQPSFLGYEP
jgi:beta-mannosidase